jgi:hypothetical protein
MIIKWISIKDKFPQNGQTVLTTDSRIPNSFFINTFMDTPQRGKHWIDCNNHIFWYGISYWMPFPELPSYK